MRVVSGAGTLLKIGHTADFDAAELARARDLLYVVFDDMTECDWEHGLGGLHVMAWQGDAIVGHASLIQRRLLHGGAALRTGYVEAVAVHPDHRRVGLGGRMMEFLEGAIAHAYDLGALGASDEGALFYRQRGWALWRGPLSALTPAGVVRTPEEEGCIFVRQGQVSLDLDGELTCDFRDGDVW
jgi:aminoglycoside 2'-N-acetyltransferase I